MEQKKGGRTLERATSLLYAGLGALATGYTLLGVKDISTYDTDQFRYTFEPTATFGLAAGMAAAGALAYTGVSRLMKKLEGKTAENSENERKEIRAKGCIFSAPLVGLGLLGAAYNHDAIPIPHVDPAPIFNKIPTELTTADPERRRNLRFLTKHLVMPDLSELTTQTITQKTQLFFNVQNPTNTTLIRSRSIVEGNVNGIPAVYHQLFDGDGADPTKLDYRDPNGREYLAIGDKTLLLCDKAMEEHPNYTRVRLISLPDARLSIRPKFPVIRLSNGKAQYFTFEKQEHTNELARDFVNYSFAPDKYFGNLTIRDLNSGKELVSLDHAVISTDTECPTCKNPCILYATPNGDRLRAYTLNPETLETRPARADEDVLRRFRATEFHMEAPR